MIELKKRILFITAENSHGLNSGPGIIKKITEQIIVMNNSGITCEYYYLPYLMNELSLCNKIKRKFSFFNMHKHWGLNEKIIKADGLYIRRLGEWDKYMLDFLKKIKRKNPGCKIVWEIPTYPYDSEYKKNWKTWPILLKDRLYRRYADQCVDRIVTLTSDKKIFNIPTLQIKNGIDLKQIQSRNCSCYSNGMIHMIAVAKFAWWHGYDRFIEGLHNYYANGGKRNIVFHLVGDGTELPKYRALTAKYKLDSHVIFHGMQSGDVLNEIYDLCSLGIGSLGAYRKGLTESAELKSREYLAKGIPFICSAHVLDIKDKDVVQIYLRVPNNDPPIDIPSVLAFYDRIYQEPETQVIARLRKYAEDHFSMDAAMKEVIDYFKSEEV